MSGEIPVLDRAELEALQLERLRDTVRRVHAHVPHYARAFDEAGVKPADLTSNLNPVAGQIVANLAIVPLDSSGAVCLEGLTPSDLVVDLQDWYPA